MPKKHTIEFIREEFRRYGYTLVSTEYRKMGASLEYICDKHPDKTSRMSYGNLVAGTRCRHCRGEERRFNIDEVKAILLENECELVSTVYEGNAKPIEYRCFHHYSEVQTSTLNNIQQRQGCPLCRSENLSIKYSGENHHCWKGGFHSESQRARRNIEYRNWRLSVFKRDGFTCQCCGDSRGRNLEAHHLVNFSNNIKLRYDVVNGITLCNQCHNPKFSGSFHNLYGTKDNTKEQLIEYLQSKGAYYKGAFSIEKTLKGVLGKWQEE